MHPREAGKIEKVCFKKTATNNVVFKFRTGEIIFGRQIEISCPHGAWSGVGENNRKLELVHACIDVPLLIFLKKGCKERGQHLRLMRKVVSVF